LLAFQNEVEICRGVQPFEIKVGHSDELPNSPGCVMETESIASSPESSSVTLQKLTGKIEHCLDIFLYLYSLVCTFLSYFLPK
jgi:hypothetical protein